MAGTFSESVPITADTTLGPTHKNRILDVVTGATNKTLTVPDPTTYLDGEFFYVRKDDAAAGHVILDGDFDYELSNENQYIAIATNTVKWRIMWHN